MIENKKKETIIENKKGTMIEDKKKKNDRK
jgi:hypothetical protein